MDLTQFRQLVDAHSPQLPSGLQEMYEYVGLPQEGSYRTQEVSKKLYQAIANSFTSSREEAIKTCRNLRSQLVYESELDNRPLDPYATVLYHIGDALNTPRTAESMEDNWGQAIQNALDHTLVSPIGNGLNVQWQEFAVAKAAKSLQRKGYELIRSGAKIFIEPKSELCLIKALERLILSIGGINVARRIFYTLAPHYYQGQERYLFNINSGNIYATPLPFAPYGYLLMLAVKNPVGKKPLRNTEETWKSLLGLATEYATLHEVQNFNPMPQFNIPVAMLTEKLRELALFDVLFRLPQARPFDVVDMVRGLLSEYDFDAIRDGRWTINQFLTVTEFIFQRSRHTRGPHSFSLSEIKAECSDVPEAQIDYLVSTVLSHPQSGANQNFVRPIDAPYLDPETRAAGYDFYFKPLIRSGAETFVLVDRSVCAPNFLEALFAALRDKEGKGFDDKLGNRIERYLTTKLVSQGINCLTGDYWVNGEQGECDIVIETTEVIFFIEIKKKPLTRDARAGSDIHLLIDMASSLIAAQVQAGWHELRLRTKTFLDLEHNGKTTRLELRGRRVERVAISLLDYGGLQDRLSTHILLNASLSAAFSLRDDAPSGYEKRFSNVNTVFEELTQQTIELHKEEEDPRYFFNCWFLSVPQLLMMLDGVHGPEEFKQAFWQTKSVVMNAQDFYYELEQGRRRHAYAKEQNH